VFKLLERSPLPPALSGKDLPGGQTEIINVRRIPRISYHPVNSGQDKTPESIADTKHWLNCNSNLHNPNDCDDHCVADNTSDMKQNNCVEDP
jgi:hypothetical protein